MNIYTDAFICAEYETKQETLKYIEFRCQKLQKSLRRVEKNSEHLIVRCPLSGDYLEVIGTPAELDWLDNELRKRNWYRPN